MFSFFLILGCQNFEQKSALNDSLSCPAHLQLVKVKKAIDGDTVLLEGGERLRYAGINALELHTSSGIPEPYAEEAYLKNRELTEGKKLCLEIAQRKRDKYGRLLGDLYFENGTSVSEILVSEGLAFVCYYEGSSSFFERLLPIQRKALVTKKNLFSYVDKAQGKSIYIGNKNSRRFHHPACKEGKGIKRKIIFKSLEEALWEGYCPSRECISLIFSHN